jgi:hypothetical protein
MSWMNRLMAAPARVNGAPLIQPERVMVVVK